jgi:hypothetical protein
MTRRDLILLLPGALAILVLAWLSLCVALAR